MSSFKSNRGSVLIVALIFAVILAIALTSYLKLSLNASQMANRAFYLNAAQNIVDMGIERTLWSLNNAHLYSPPSNWTTGGFTARSGFSNEYQGTFPSSGTFYPLSGNAKGQVKVWAAYNTTTKYWHTVAQATITLGDGTTLSKTAECYLKQRSWSQSGMVARNGISFNGSVMIDSWISRPTGPPSDVPYSSGVSRCEAQVCSPSLIAIQNADVYGRVAIGTDTITAAGITVGANGRVQGVKPGTATIDATRVTCDFTSSLPDVNLPGSSGTAIAAITGGVTSFTANATYTTPSINLGGGGDRIEVGPTPAANVSLIVTGNVDMSGPSKIIIHPGSSLTMYVAGDFRMVGNSGIQNGTTTAPNNPDCFTLLGTRTEMQIAGGAMMQDWTLKGTSSLSAVIYGPNANVAVGGTGDTFGSVVGNRVDMVGSGNFHQDESLAANLKTGLWALLKWRELATATERGTYATELSF
jgi:hypothetical protein